MKIRITQSFTYPGCATLQVGEILNVAPEIGEKFVRDGVAEDLTPFSQPPVPSPAAPSKPIKTSKSRTKASKKKASKC